MWQFTHSGLREGTARQPELIRREDLTKSAPTEPEAFPRWGAQPQRKEGRFELSRGRVTCDIINASRPHARVAKNLVGQLALGGLDIGLAMAAIFRGIRDAPTVE
jgi:hypothetical protein